MNALYWQLAEDVLEERQVWPELPALPEMCTVCNAIAF